MVTTPAILTPTRLVLPEEAVSRLQPLLRCRDQRFEYELSRLKRNYSKGWTAMTPQDFAEEQERLKQRVWLELITRDRETNTPSTHAGLYRLVEKTLGCGVQDLVQPPAFRPTRRVRPLPKNFTERPFQREAAEALLAHRHAAVEIGTGLGKSYIIELLFLTLGNLRGVLVVPSINLAEKAVRDLRAALGDEDVGEFFDQKKQSNRRITVAVLASLVRVKPETQTWKDLSSVDVVAFDESHICAADTAEEVATGLLARATRRVFFSATQRRSDGLDLLLQGITGPVVYRKTVREGIAEGYLAKLNFRMFKVRSTEAQRSFSEDSTVLTRRHLYRGKTVNQAAGGVINHLIGGGLKTLVLIEEMEQFACLLPHLRTRPHFAHGGVTKTNKGCLPEAFWKSDPLTLVDEFNAGDFPLLIGTSCIGVGADVKPRAVVYLQGGKSEVMVPQAVGRATRLDEGKTDCYFVDFDVYNVPALHRHAEERRRIYRDIYAAAEESALS